MDKSCSEYYKIVSECHIYNGIIDTTTRKVIVNLPAAKRMVLFDEVTGFVYVVMKAPEWDINNKILKEFSNKVTLTFYKSRKDWDSGINYSNKTFIKVYGHSLGSPQAKTINNLNEIRFIRQKDEKEFYPKDLLEKKSSI